MRAYSLHQTVWQKKIGKVQVLPQVTHRSEYLFHAPSGFSNQFSPEGLCKLQVPKQCEDFCQGKNRLVDVSLYHAKCPAHCPQNEPTVTQSAPGALETIKVTFPVKILSPKTDLKLKMLPQCERPTDDWLSKTQESLRSRNVSTPTNKGGAMSLGESSFGDWFMDTTRDGRGLPSGDGTEYQLF